MALTTLAVGNGGTWTTLTTTQTFGSNLSVTPNSGTDIWTYASGGLDTAMNGHRLSFTGTGGGVSTSTNYFWAIQSATTFRLYDTMANALTDDGSTGLSGFGVAPTTAGNNWTPYAWNGSSQLVGFARDIFHRL